ncbi:hypothetical protein DV738_g3672, partial [Chaetothyriales sp. CBS 135597]
MDDQVQRLANKAWTKFQTLDASQRLLIAIAGIPGSGKTTLAALVQLAEMPNAEEAIFRRGAAFTFDSNGFFELVRQVRAPLQATTATIYAPSFDHAIKDPVPNDIGIPATARIVVFEGLYIALDREGWRDAAKLMDELWFVEVPFPVASERVAKRNYAAGISSSLEESIARTEANDMRNGREVVAERLPVHELVQSVDDVKWRSEPAKTGELK